MIAYVRSGVAILAVVALASCAKSSNAPTKHASEAACSQTSALSVVPQFCDDSCAPTPFACEGLTPGFWSNRNGCAQLTGNPQLLENLNAFLASVGVDAVSAENDCADLDVLLKVDAVDMTQKLVAMFSAFSLNYWNDWGPGCTADALAFYFSVPAGACGSYFADFDNLVTYENLGGAVADALALGADGRCQQEVLKDFFDAVNNNRIADVCSCGCVTGATGATGASGQ